jgi:hypothetical protein
MSTQALRVRPVVSPGAVAVLLVWLFASIALTLAMATSGANAGPETARMQGPPQAIYVIGTNDAAFRKAYPNQHCVYTEEGSRYGSPACRP